MKNSLACLLVFFLPILVFSTDLGGSWVLEKSEISYIVTHPLHVVHGKSLSAKGKGVCYGGHCEFHVGVLVKSFDSGDHNRDLHMLEVTRAGLFPLIQVDVEWAEKSEKKTPERLTADLTIHFAGKAVKFPNVQLDVLELKSDKAHVVGTIPLSLKGFGIQAPSLLAMPVQDEVPVKLDVVWKRAGSKARKQK